MGLKERLSILREKQKEDEGEIPEPGGELVVVKDGNAVTSSIEFAAHFQKNHDQLMRDIRKSGCSPEFRSLHFCRD